MSLHLDDFAQAMFDADISSCTIPEPAWYSLDYVDQVRQFVSTNSQMLFASDVASAPASGHYKGMTDSAGSLRVDEIAAEVARVFGKSSDSSNERKSADAAAKRKATAEQDAGKLDDLFHRHIEQKMQRVQYTVSLGKLAKAAAEHDNYEAFARACTIANPRIVCQEKPTRRDKQHWGDMESDDDDDDDDDNDNDAEGNSEGGVCNANLPSRIFRGLLVNRRVIADHQEGVDISWPGCETLDTALLKCYFDPAVLCRVFGAGDYRQDQVALVAERLRDDCLHCCFSQPFGLPRLSFDDARLGYMRACLGTLIFAAAADQVAAQHRHLLAKMVDNVQKLPGFWRGTRGSLSRPGASGKVPELHCLFWHMKRQQAGRLDAESARAGNKQVAARNVLQWYQVPWAPVASMDQADIWSDDEQFAELLPTRNLYAGLRALVLDAAAKFTRDQRDAVLMYNRISERYEHDNAWLYCIEAGDAAEPADGPDSPAVLFHSVGDPIFAGTAISARTIEMLLERQLCVMYDVFLAESTVDSVPMSQLVTLETDDSTAESFRLRTALARALFLDNDGAARPDARVRCRPLTNLYCLAGKSSALHMRNIRVALDAATRNFCGYASSRCAHNFLGNMAALASGKSPLGSGDATLSTRIDGWRGEFNAWTKAAPALCIRSYEFDGTVSVSDKADIEELLSYASPVWEAGPVPEGHRSWGPCVKQFDRQLAASGFLEYPGYYEEFLGQVASLVADGDNGGPLISRPDMTAPYLNDVRRLAEDDVSLLRHMYVNPVTIISDDHFGLNERYEYWMLRQTLERFCLVFYPKGDPRQKSLRSQLRTAARLRAAVQSSRDSWAAAAAAQQHHNPVFPDLPLFGWDIPLVFYNCEQFPLAEIERLLALFLYGDTQAARQSAGCRQHAEEQNQDLATDFFGYAAFSHVASRPERHHHQRIVFIGDTRTPGNNGPFACALRHVIGGDASVARVTTRRSEVSLSMDDFTNAPVIAAYFSWLRENVSTVQCAFPIDGNSDFVRSIVGNGTTLAKKEQCTAVWKPFARRFEFSVAGVREQETFTSLHAYPFDELSLFGRHCGAGAGANGDESGANITLTPSLSHYELQSLKPPAVLIEYGEGARLVNRLFEDRYGGDVDAMLQQFQSRRVAGNFDDNVCGGFSTFVGASDYEVPATVWAWKFFYQFIHCHRATGTAQNLLWKGVVTRIPFVKSLLSSDAADAVAGSPAKLSTAANLPHHSMQSRSFAIGDKVLFRRGRSRQNSRCLPAVIVGIRLVTEGPIFQADTLAGDGATLAGWISDALGGGRYQVGGDGAHETSEVRRACFPPRKDFVPALDVDGACGLAWSSREVSRNSDGCGGGKLYSYRLRLLGEDTLLCHERLTSAEAGEWCGYFVALLFPDGTCLEFKMDNGAGRWLEPAESVHIDDFLEYTQLRMLGSQLDFVLLTLEHDDVEDKRVHRSQVARCALEFSEQIIFFSTEATLRSLVEE